MKDNENNFPKMPQGGGGKLRDLLASLGEEQERMTNHPLYREGYDDGYMTGKAEAEEASKCLVRALNKLYNNEDC